MEYTAIFEGGGIKGLAYVGAICALEEEGFVCKKAAGTSIGAIFAGLLVAGYTGKEVTYLMQKLTFSQLLYQNKTKLKSIFQDKGLYSSFMIESYLDYLLMQKRVRYLSDLTYQQKELKVVSYDMTQKKSVVLPDALPVYGYFTSSFPLARMITYSMLFPGFFQPLKLGDSFLVDGGVSNNFPCHVFPYKEDELVIGFRILKKEYKGCPPTMHMISIDTKSIKTLDFKVTEAEKMKLFQAGYLATKQEIQRIKAKRLLQSSDKDVFI